MKLIFFPISRTKSITLIPNEIFSIDNGLDAILTGILCYIYCNNDNCNFSSINTKFPSISINDLHQYLAILEKKNYIETIKGFIYVVK